MQYTKETLISIYGTGSDLAASANTPGRTSLTKCIT